MSVKEWYEGCWVNIKVPTPYLVACPECQGARCAQCKGVGKIVRSYTKFHVPARLNYHKLMMVSHGGKRDQDGNYGTLYIQVRLMNFDHFYLNGSNLHTTVKVPPAVLRFGGEWDVPVTEDQMLRVTIPPRMKVRGKLRLAGYGVLRDDRRRGDMLVEVRRWQPTTLRQAVVSWGLYLVLGLRNTFSPVVSWWNRQATT